MRKKKNIYKQLIDDKCTDVAKLSEKTGIQYGTLYRKINNEGRFYLDEIQKITKALNLTRKEVDFYFLA